MARRQLGGTGIVETCWTLLLLALAIFGGGSDGYTKELFEGDPCQGNLGVAGVCRRSDRCGWLRGALRRNEENIVLCGFEQEVAVVCCPNEGAQRTNWILEVAAKMCVDDTLGYHMLGAKEAKKGEVPFIGALGYKTGDPETKEDRYIWGCGSSLIAPCFLLTAAHCINSIYGRPATVRMGLLNLNNAQDGVQNRSVKQTFSHPDYKRPRKYDDIALIEVVSPFQYNNLVKPVCLGTSLEDMDPTVPLLAAGWGMTQTRSASPEALFIGNLTTVPIDQCRKNFENVPTSMRNGISDSQYCAIGLEVNQLERTDACEGDSGGPLYYTTIINGVKKYHQIGIISFGVNCGSPLPGVYTRVAHYLEWIVSKVWPVMEAST